MVPSIRDVAKRAGVSPATVSRIMNQTANVSSEKADAVREAMEYYHYQPNHFGRALVKQQSNMIGVSLAVYKKGSMSSLDTLYTLELLKGVERTLSDTEYNIVLVNNTQKQTEGTPFAYWNLLQQHRIDGLILSGLDRELEKQMEDAQKEGPLPVVYMGRRCSSAGKNIYAQNEIYTEEMLKRVYAEGHRKVLLYHSPNHLQAVQKICGDLQKEMSDFRIFPVSHWAEAAACTEQIMAELKKYVLEKGCTAVCGANMELAGYFLRACSQLNIRVPEQLSMIMVEYKKGEGEQFLPAVSAYYVPAQEMGAAAARVLIQLIEGHQEENSVKREFETKYIPRETLVPPEI